MGLMRLQSVPTLGNVSGIRQHFTPIRTVATATKLAIKFSLIAVQIMKSNAADRNRANIKLPFGNVSTIDFTFGFTDRIRPEFG